MKEYLKNVPIYKPGKPIDELKRELGLKFAIKLASNENPYPPSPLVVKAICRAAKKINRYPESGVFYLRKRISQIHNVEEDEIIFGNGSDEIISFAVRSLLSPGDEIIVSKPTFLIYKIAAMRENIRVREIEVTKDFKYNLHSIIGAVTSNTKMVFVANPENPTGLFLSKNELDWLVRNLSSNICIFIDEAYYEFVRDRDDCPNAIDYIRQHRSVIISRTFSKYYALAGLRIGYAFARKDIIDAMNRVREPFNVNLIAQEAALAALDSEDYYRKMLQKILDGREYLEREFKKMGLFYIPSQTNFVLVEVGKRASSLVEELLKRGVIVRGMKAWGLDEFIRVTVGIPSENKRLIKEMKRLLFRR